MKIEVTEGCIAYSCYIDNKDYDEYSKEELKDILHKMIEKCEDTDILKELVWEVTAKIGEYEYEGRCDDCGDTIIKYTCEI